MAPYRLLRKMQDAWKPPIIHRCFRRKLRSCHCEIIIKRWGIIIKRVENYFPTCLPNLNTSVLHDILFQMNKDLLVNLILFRSFFNERGTQLIFPTAAVGNGAFKGCKRCTKFRTAEWGEGELLSPHKHTSEFNRFQWSYKSYANNSPLELFWIRKRCGGVVGILPFPTPLSQQSQIELQVLKAMCPVATVCSRKS